MTSQGDRDALIDAMAGYELDEGYSLSDAQAADLLDALLALPDTLLRVLLEARKPCDTCWGRVNDVTPGARCKNPACVAGEVPLVDREQVLAALGMERVSSRRWNPEWNVWDYWTPEGFEAEGDHRGWELVFAFRVPVPEPSEGASDEG